MLVFVICLNKQTNKQVSCTEFIRLFFRLQGDVRWRHEDPHFKKNKPLLKNLPLDRVNQILNDPTWTRFVAIN